jgi:hypothetical protein
MKGLLQRLAARAAGAALPIHSDARLPFVKARPLIEERVEGIAGASHGDIVAAQPAAAPRTALREARLPDSLFEPDTASSPARARQASAAAREAQTSPPRVETPAQTTRRTESGPTPPPTVTGARPVQTTAPPRAEPVERAPSQELDESPRAPARLLPAASREPAHVVRRPAESPAAAGREAAAVPAEVHLHIGRIEVAAMTPPSPAPRTRAAPRPAAMQRDTYLSRRRK